MARVESLYGTTPAIFSDFSSPLEKISAGVVASCSERKVASATPETALT